MDTTNEARLNKIFAGLERAHGEYREKSDLRKSDNKVQGSAKTVDGPLTEEHWKAHLAGNYGVGAVPVTDAGTCSFAAIDFDKYNEQTVKRFVTDAKKSGFPFVWCKSKSGGAHLYLFFSEPAPAAAVRKKLAELAKLLGYPKMEVFPKQGNLEPGQIGNWINLPYFRAVTTDRYAFDDTGQGIADVEAFLDYAEARRISPEAFEALTIGKQEIPFSDAPPCIQQMAHAGIADGERNKSLFQFAIYAKKKHPEDWEAQVLEWNGEYFAPGLPYNEVKNTIFKSLAGDKEYGYLCKEPVCSEVCNKPLCQTREFGISGGQLAEVPEGAVLLSGNHTTLTAAAKGIVDKFTEQGGLYRRGNSPARVYDDKLQLISDQSFRSVIEELGKPVRYITTNRGEVKLSPAAVSADNAKGIMSTAEIQRLPEVQLVSRVPLLNRDGTLMSKGWNQGGVYVTHADPVEEIDHETAAAELLDLLGDYAFVTENDRARAFAAFITPTLRQSKLIDGHVPVEFNEANKSQTGKTKLHKATREIYNQPGIGVIAKRKGGVGGTDEAVGAALAKGAPFIVLDNLRGKIDSEYLEAVITGDVVNVRLMHRDASDVDVSRVCIQATSNNATCTVDLANRLSTVRIRKQPPGYKFKYQSLELQARNHWPRYYACVVAIVRNWLAAGRPQIAATHDFKEWAGSLNWIVQQYKLPDLMGGHEEIKARTSSRSKSWLRGIAPHMELFKDYKLTGLIDLAAENEVSLQVGGDDKGIKMQLGRVLAPAFKDGDAKLDEYVIRRESYEFKDKKGRVKIGRTYRLTAGKADNGEF